MIRLLLGILAIVLIASCSKEEVKVDSCDSYTLEVAFYTLDTIPATITRGEATGKTGFTMHRWDNLCGDHPDKAFLESQQDMWSLSRNKSTPLVQMYYTKNGKKIWQSRYPK